MDQEVIKYRIQGTEYVGTFEIRGYVLTLTCGMGTIRATVGLSQPKKLAKQLMRVLHRRLIGTADQTPAHNKEPFNTAKISKAKTARTADQEGCML